MNFDLIKETDSARRGRLEFLNGTIETPVFMPVGTYGTVKAMTPEELIDIETEIILANTFHLMLRPGADVIRKFGTNTDKYQKAIDWVREYYEQPTYREPSR